MSSTDTDFDFEPAYRETVSPWMTSVPGIAWRVTGYATEWTPETWEYLGEPENYDPDTYYAETGYHYPDEDPANYAYGEPEEIEDRTRVVAHMIGDDRDFTFDVGDLEPIADGDYCDCCGQIGCQWGTIGE